MYLFCQFKYVTFINNDWIPKSSLKLQQTQYQKKGDSKEIKYHQTYNFNYQYKNQFVKKS